MRRCWMFTVFAPVVAALACRFTAPAAAAPTTITVMVDGIQRTALVQPGLRSATTPSPLLIFFHGLGGSSRDGLDLGIATA